ncbi:MAG: lysophospholipid acyltransferase family protein [Planctomycetaceae bacterium]
MASHSGLRRARFLVEYLIFQALVFVLRCLPVRTSVRFADAVAWCVHSLVPRKVTRYAVAAENIRTALGADTSDQQVDRIILGMWQHLTRMICEIVQLPRRFRLQNCSDVLTFRNRDECVQAIMQGRPVLFLGGHFGNWEISVNTFGSFGFPMGVVARDLDNPWLHRWFQQFRESTGNWTISKQGASVELVQAMESGGCASLLCDQDAGRRGVFVDFFGKPASTFKSIALLALQYDAVVIVGGAWRLPDAEQTGSRWRQFELCTEAVIDSRDFTTAHGVTELTQAFTSALESLVRRAPDQYFWVHRRWKTPAPASGKRRSQAA